MARHTAHMLLGDTGRPPDAAGAAPATTRLSLTARTPLITALVALTVLGITAWPINTLLNLAAGTGH
jgi:hydrogenase-4 component F